MPGTTLASYFQQMPRPSAALEEAIEARSRAEQQTFEEWKKKAYEQAARGEIVSYGIPAYVKESNCELAKWGGKYILTNELTLCRPPAQQH
jgi:hypothetical protein